MGSLMPVLNIKDNDFFFMNRENPVVCASTVSQLVANRLPEAYGFSPLDDIQILCPSRKGDCGTVNLNRKLQEVLNPPDRTKNELKTSGGRLFREGDKVMQVRNNYNIPWNKGAEAGEGIFNGDIGMITAIDTDARTVEILFDDERLAEYESSELEQIEHSYAVTVHKSQGSEFPIVIMPMSWFPPMLATRNLLYTGVTRGKTAVVLVGSENKMHAMVDNNRITGRYSGLGVRLKMMMEFH